MPYIMMCMSILHLIVGLKIHAQRDMEHHCVLVAICVAGGPSLCFSLRLVFADLFAME